MWLRGNYRWLSIILMGGIWTVAGNAFAEDDVNSAELSAPESPEAASPAPRHRMHQALIGQRPRCDTRTLGAMLRHLGGEENACPLCGQECGTAEDDSDEDDARDRPAGGSLLSKAPFLQRFLVSAHADHGDSKSEAQRESADLRPGEPAQVILDLKRRLGSDVYEGTQFGGSTKALVDWIRALDEQDRRQPPQPDADEPASDPSITASSPQTAGAATEIDALRKAARKLGEAADLLEEQNLFDPADEVRLVADELRLRARERIQASQASSEKPVR